MIILNKNSVHPYWTGFLDHLGWKMMVLIWHKLSTNWKTKIVVNKKMFHVLKVQMARWSTRWSLTKIGHFSILFADFRDYCRLWLYKTNSLKNLLKDYDSVRELFTRRLVFWLYLCILLREVNLSKIVVLLFYWVDISAFP